MGKREQAREEARFMRGEVGIDGAAVEEEKDLAEVEKDKAREALLRNRTWLGREFLTWLLWRSDEGGELAEYDGAGIEALFTGKIVLRGVHGEVHELSAAGTLAPYSENVRHSLARGLLLHQARVRLVHNERAWEATLDAEYLDVRAAKLPELLTEEEDDRVTERLDLVEQLSALIDTLVGAFLATRASPAWRKKVVPQMRAWMEEGSQNATTLSRAARVGRAK